MLYIVNAQIRKVDRSLYGDDTVTNYSVTHAVEAETKTEAEALLRLRYDSKSQMDDPYGRRYYVDDLDIFDLITKENAKVDPHDY